MGKRLTLEDLKFWNLIKASVKADKPIAIQPLGRFNPTLDLHGHQTHRAWHSTLQHIAEAKVVGLKKVTVITGKSGPINAEFERWLENRSDIRKIAVKNGGGAYDIWLRKGS